MPLGVFCSTKRVLLYKAPGNTDGTRICILFTRFRCFIDKWDNKHRRRAALGFNPDARWAEMPFGPASVFLLTVEKALLLTWAFQCLKLGGFNLSFHIQGHWDPCRKVSFCSFHFFLFLPPGQTLFFNWTSLFRFFFFFFLLSYRIREGKKSLGNRQYQSWSFGHKFVLSKLWGQKAKAIWKGHRWTDPLVPCFARWSQNATHDCSSGIWKEHSQLSRRQHHHTKMSINSPVCEAAFFCQTFLLVEERPSEGFPSVS